MSKKSLIESNPGAGLPVAFEGVGGPIAAVDPLFSPTPYVVFVSTKGQSFATLARQIPELQDGDPVLVRGKEGRKLNPFKFYLVAAFQHFSMVDTQGGIVKTTFDPSTAKADRAWQEHVEALVIVADDDELTPARVTFKTTKTNAVHTAIKELNLLHDDPEEWASNGKEYKAAMALPIPWARFITTVSLRRATSRSSGFAYVAANGLCTPSGVADWKILADAMKDPDFNSLCADVLRRHEQRIAEVKAKEAA